MKDYDKAIRATKHVLPVYNIKEEDIKEIERIYRESGYVSAYEEILRHLEKFAENNPVGFEEMALRYIMANQPDKAMDWIEKGFDMHEQQMAYIFINKPGSFYAILWDNPRFIAICEKMNLPLPKSD